MDQSFTDRQTITGQNDDDGIIDITGQSTTIIYHRNDTGLVRYPPGIPFWKHQYIYSYSELISAGPEQTAFYQHFKKSFLLDCCLDLEGNNNYAFILLFDLLGDFKSHGDLPQLERQILRLVVAYPKTRPYGLSMLSLVMEEHADSSGIERIREFQQSQLNDYGLKLGNKFRKKLLLKDAEVELLNRIWYPDNNFCNIEFCLTETVKLYLLVVQALEHRYQKEGKVSAVEFNTLADLVTMRRLGTGVNNYNYKYTILSALNDIYSLIFKYTENALREAFGHTQKLNTDLSFQDADILEQYEQKLLSKLLPLLPIWVSRIEQPDEATEITLFTRNTARWKLSFDIICAKQGHQSKQYYDSISNLARLNHQNPSAEMIWFESARFIAKQDQVVALKLYVHYIYQDLNSAVFDNRKLNKTIQKSLFHTTEQLADFERIINELIQDKDLQKALEAVSHLYEPKRRKIILNRDAISQISEKHSDTVELLSKYLDDDTEPTPESITTPTLTDGEIAIKIVATEPQVPATLYDPSLTFSPIQQQVLTLFRKANFTVPMTELEAFARENGVFKNQVVDSINERCYELLDDILIEEEENNYLINEAYYLSILMK